MKVVPLTPARWKDFEALFGENGACAGCWCQWIRLPAAQYRKIRGAGAKSVMKRSVLRGETPGLLAYEGKRAVGWCAVGPRSDFQRLERSRVLKAVDDKPVWSAPCFFVAKDARGKGVTRMLLDAAARFARAKGAGMMEGYPVEADGRTADAFLWWGTASTFRKAGFSEAARRSPTRPVMRKRLR